MCEKIKSWFNKFVLRMADTEEKTDRAWHENFINYTEMIVKHPNYAGLFFERKAEGRVKWVAAGKLDKGQLRRQWWDEQCAKAGIKVEAGCYAKIAVAIHPTKKHVCQICGKALSVEYVYPDKRTLTALNQKLSADIKPYTLTIFEIIDKYGVSSSAIENIKSAFKIESCVATNAHLGDYIFKNCQTHLSPGVMSNSPDRFDGFHSDGNCCRGTSDKGRHNENLQRYSQDRRVYENWADGNWKMADRLMAEFAKHGVSADHIGPISLGFCHRAKFQPMTKSENSAKNNRMSFCDVQTLLADEAKGEQVISWHSKYIWDTFKNRITNDTEAVKVSTIMRNNLHQILLIFSIISENGYNDFLTEFLNPLYSFYDYSLKDFDPQTGEYKEVKTKNLTGKNQQNNVDRYLRIAFESLEGYKTKDNRKQYAWDSADIDESIEQTLQFLSKGNKEKAIEQLKVTFQKLAEIADVNSKWITVTVTSCS